MKKITVCLGLLVAGVCASPRANAQLRLPNGNASVMLQAQTTPSPAEKAELSGFEAAFTALSQKYQTAFVCESAPYQATLSPSAAAALQKTLSVTPALSKQSKQDEITDVALAYDYDAVFLNDHTVLLTKRYSQAKDLPEITLDETALYLNNLLKEATPYIGPTDDEAKKDPRNDPKYNASNPKLNGVMIDLYQSATPEQKAAYAKGVRWGDMPADVQARWVYSQSSLSQTIPWIAFRGITNRINGVKKPNATVFKTIKYFGISLSAYEGPFRSAQRPDRWPVTLSAYVKTTPGGASTYAPPGKYVMEKNKVINPVPDPTTPTPEELNATAKPNLACQRTLAEVAADMNARIAKVGAGADSVVRVDMPAAFDTKTVSVIGAEAYLSPLEEVKAIGEVYGLRGVLGQDGVATIALPKAIKDVDPTQIWVEALHALPVPVFRALRGPSPRFPDAKVFDHPIEANQINKFKAGAVYIEAAKRLRILVDPKIAALGEGKVLPLEEAPSESKYLIALSSLVDIAAWLDTLALPRASSEKNIEARANLTFKMFQEGDQITYRFLGEGLAGGSSFPIPTATTPAPQTP